MTLIGGSRPLVRQTATNTTPPQKQKNYGKKIAKGVALVTGIALASFAAFHVFKYLNKAPNPPNLTFSQNCKLENECKLFLKNLKPGFPESYVKAISVEKTGVHLTLTSPELLNCNIYFDKSINVDVMPLQWWENPFRENFDDDKGTIFPHNWDDRWDSSAVKCR